MNINDIKKAYFIGIKGAGMTAVAEIMHDRGIDVSGSDTKETFFTDEILKRHSIPFFEEFSSDNIRNDVDVFVYSSAYNEDNNIEIAEAKKTGVPMLVYSEMLGMLFDEKLGIAVCGTHGKTTTSAMLADVFKKTGLDPSAVVGSQVISWRGSSLAGKGDYFIAEADEYQNKLKYYNPWSAILTSVDWDHPDFFPDFESYKKVFKDFVERISATGNLVVWGDSHDTLQVAKSAKCKIFTYGFVEDNDYVVKNISVDNLFQSFEVFYKENSLGIFEIPLVGKHNILNATSIIALCHAMKLDLEKVKNALKEFKGTTRRFERIGNFGGASVIDDYAHHPDEVKATLEGARQHFREKIIWTVFHPHTFTRTKALLGEFSQSFDDTDKVIVIDIYGSAREQQGGVTSTDLVNLINKYNRGKAEYISTQEEVIKYLQEKAGQYDVLITMGAGDVWKVGKKLVNN